jgi:hypothetical protein
MCTTHPTTNVITSPTIKAPIIEVSCGEGNSKAENCGVFTKLVAGNSRQSCPSSNHIEIPIHTLCVPKHYTVPIPAVTKAVYDALGIHYVHIRGPGGQDHYVLSTMVESIVSDLQLYM